jgi:hypothetical protein
MFYQAESIMYHLCMEAGIPNLCECLIHQGAAAMVGVKDLEGIVMKVLWFCVVRSGAWVSVEVDLVDRPHESLCSSCCWVWSLQVVLDPLARFDVPIFLIWDPYRCTIKQVILHPPIVPHEDVFLCASDVLKMLSKSRATWRLGAADVLDDCGFLFLYFFLGSRYGAGEDLQLPLHGFERVVYARPVCIVMFIEVVGMFGAESSMGDVQDVEAEAPQSEGPATGGAEEEVGCFRVLVDEREVAGAEIVDGGSSVFFVVVAVATLAPCVIIGSSRTCCTRSRTASRRATSASMDDGGFKIGED